MNLFSQTSNFHLPYLSSANHLLKRQTLNLSFSSSLSTVAFRNPKYYHQHHQRRTLLSVTSGVKAAMSSAEQARVPPALSLPSPPVSKFKIALCQLSVTADKMRNIAHAREAIEEAAQKGVQLVLLPEVWNSPYSNDSFPVYAEDIEAGDGASPSTAMLSEGAQSLKITIVGGSIPERWGDRLYNTCCVFGTDGKLKAKHRKIHLFDIDIPGQITSVE